MSENTEFQGIDIDEQELRELGLDSAAEELLAKKQLKRKLTIAYEHFRFVTPGIVQRFNAELQKRTRQDHKQYYRYDTLAFIPLKSYKLVPPKDVLQKIRDARAMNCFDGYEVAKIESVEVRKDPIVFGIINGCADRFYVAQWDNDVKIEQLLKENEG